MLHTLSNTFLFPQPQLLLPLTKDKRGKALDQGSTLLNEAPLKSTGHHQEGRGVKPALETAPGMDGGAAGGVTPVSSGFGASPGRDC